MRADHSPANVFGIAETAQCHRLELRRTPALGQFQGDSMLPQAAVDVASSGARHSYFQNPGKQDPGHDPDWEEFAPDSPLEGSGFEPSVPHEVLTVGIVPCRPRTFPRFPPENEVRSGLSAGGRWIRTLGPPATAG